MLHKRCGHFLMWVALPRAALRAACAGVAATVLVAGCSTAPSIVPARQAAPIERAAPAAGDTGARILNGKSQWVPVPWSDLPGLAHDTLFEAWNAWLRGCERAAVPLLALCSEVRQLSIATSEEQRSWMQRRLRPYRVESLQGEAQGLLTGYFEPLLDASRVPTDVFSVPLYRLPENLGQRKPWFTRQEMETHPAAQAAMRGRVIAYLANPVDALVLQIQGSGRLRMVQPDGSHRWVRLSYAGSNEHPYRSVGRWLLDQGLVKDASWSGVKEWLAANPGRQQELMWINPRVIFFKEQDMVQRDGEGPYGAHGVPLTPGRSIAIDPASIPYGAPVWISSRGSQTALQRLVFAQDTGNAISGAVRADYFVGWGPEAADVAGRLRQPLQMWVLWPN